MREEETGKKYRSYALPTPPKLPTPSPMKPDTRRFDPDLLRQVAILGSIAINILSNLLPLNGVNVGRLSNTLFASVQIIPANDAFAIWGLVYFGLIVFGIYQLEWLGHRCPSLDSHGDNRQYCDRNSCHQPSVNPAIL